jgi:hypothetical protein
MPSFKNELTTQTNIAQVVDSVKGGRSRPRVGESIRQIVVRPTRETGWGYGQILGELRKMRIRFISESTIKNILKEEVAAFAALLALFNSADVSVLRISFRIPIRNSR